MKISVVIPLYNKEQYIGRAIESVLKQTVPSDDIVIVDDGSTDNSADEVEKFNDPRVRLIRQQNAGEGATRNRGVTESHNDLVAFLDADDEWKPNFLLEIQRLYRNFPACGAYATSYEIIDPGGTKSYPSLEGVPPAPWIGIIPNLFKMLELSNPFFPSSIAIPKDVYHDLKGFPEGIPQGADRMMWVCLGVQYPIAFSPSSQVLYHREAINRACNSRFTRDPVTAKLIDAMLENREVPLALIEDLKDYSASLKIQRVYHLVINGRAQEARELLGAIGSNRKYRNKILWWLFWSHMPYSFVKLAQVLRSRYRNL